MTGKYIIYTQIEYLSELDILDISKCKVITAPGYFDTKKEAIEEMILKLMEVRKDGKNN